MKKKLPIGRILAILLVVALSGSGMYLWFRKDPGIDYTKETARTGTIETYYTFSGNLEPGSVTTVSATSSGTVKECLFEEGDTVEEGKTILRTGSSGYYTAKESGTLSALYVHEGDSFTPGTPLYRIADYAHPVLNVRVDEYDVSALKKGMSVTVKVQATGQVVNGKITCIAQEAVVVNDMAFYDAEITLDEENLMMGLTCEVRVLRAYAENATTISMNAVQYDNDQHPFVYVYDRDGEITQQRVTLGINNGSVVEIKEGIRSGETILIPPAGMDELLARMAKMRNRE